MKRTLLIVLLLTGAAFAQIDNRYCTKDNQWLGTSAANPAIYDGPASLPTACLNTDPDNMPSPGPVVNVSPDQSFQAAYNAAACGTTIVLQSGGSWGDPFSFPSKGCDDQHWITIMSSGLLTPPGYRIAPSYASEMAELVIRRTSGPNVWGDHIHFLGIHWRKDSPGKGLFWFALMKGANKVVFDRNLIRCNPNEECQHGIVIGTGKYIGIIDSWLDEFHCTAAGSGADSQAISGGTGGADDDVTASGPVKIVNNFIEASTENILFGGAAANGPGPVDVEIRRNYLYKPQSWNPNDPNYVGIKYVVKNLFELKNGARILVEGNVLENVWGGFTQSGFAVLFTPKNQAGANASNLCPQCAIYDIVFRYNYIHTASGAMMIGSGANINGAYSMGQHRTSIHDNVFDNLQYPGCYGCGYVLVQLGSGYLASAPPADDVVLSDVSINNNSFLATATRESSQKFQASGLLNIGAVPPNVPTVQASNISFQNNIGATLNNGIFPTGGGTNNCAVVSRPQTPVNMWNGCFVGTSPFKGNVLVGYPSAITNWPDGNLFSPSMLTVGFHDYSQAVYSMPQDSPYVGKGANIDLVNGYTFGVREEAREAPKRGKDEDHTRRRRPAAGAVKEKEKP